MNTEAGSICLLRHDNPLKGLCHEMNIFLKAYDNKYVGYFLYMHK
jgi:hypothetical protein